MLFRSCPHPRNVTDEVLDMLRINRGVIMICFLPHLVDPSGGKEACLSQVADHIEYAGKRIGFGHVGIGSDFDGMLKGPEGLDDVSGYPALVAELLRRGLSREELKGVMGANIIRVMGEVENVASHGRMGALGVYTDRVEEVWTAEQREILASMGKQRRACP